MGSNSEEITIQKKPETIAWLLESPTPSIRYLSLTRLLGRPETDKDVQSARRSIATSNPVLHILEKQQPEGYWQYQKHYYSPKYRSSHWSMLLLSELGIDPKHPAMQKGADFMLDCIENDKRLRIEKGTFWGCLWGNILRYEIYCKGSTNQRVQDILEYVTRDVQNLSRCPYNNDLPCAWGVARGLFGLALVPVEQRSAETEEAIRLGLKFLLEDYDLLKADYPYVEKIHPTWSKLSFPLFYQSDLLFVLRLAKELDALDHPGAQRGLARLREKRNQNGTWSGGSPYQKRTWPFMARGDNVNRWISLHALSVLA